MRTEKTQLVIQESPNGDFHGVYYTLGFYSESDKQTAMYDCMMFNRGELDSPKPAYFRLVKQTTIIETKKNSKITVINEEVIYPLR